MRDEDEILDEMADEITALVDEVADDLGRKLTSEEIGTIVEGALLPLGDEDEESQSEEE